MYANSETTRQRVKPAPVTRLDQPQLIQIDSDLMPALLDMFGASGDASFAEWLGRFASDAMRGNLGL